MSNGISREETNRETTIALKSYVRRGVWSVEKMTKIEPFDI